MSFSQSEDDLGVFKEDKRRLTAKSVARYVLVFMLVAVMVGIQFSIILFSFSYCKYVV